MPTGKRYAHDYKVQAVKLAGEIGQSKAASELGISKNTIAGWVRSSRIGGLDMGPDAPALKKPLSKSEELAILKKRLKEQEKEIRQLREINEFLEEASAFFAASRQRHARKQG